MAGFVGFMAAANYENIGAPMRDSMFPTIGSGLSAPEVWDAIPFLAKLQIIGTIGFFEFYSEAAMSQMPDANGVTRSAFYRNNCNRVACCCLAHFLVLLLLQF